MEEEKNHNSNADAEKDVTVAAVSKGAGDFVRVKQEVDLPEDDTFYPMDFGISVEDEEELNPVYVKMRNKQPGSSERTQVGRRLTSAGKRGVSKAQRKANLKVRASMATLADPEQGYESPDEYIERSHNNGGARLRRPKILTGLSNEQEMEMVEWIRENECLYNKKRIDYRDVPKKNKLWAAKGKEMGKKAHVLQVWYKSIRTRYTRISNRSPTVAARLELTERDDWIMDKFSFLAKHIGVRRFKGSSLPDPLSLASPSQVPRHQANDVNRVPVDTEESSFNHLDLLPPDPGPGPSHVVGPGRSISPIVGPGPSLSPTVGPESGPASDPRGWTVEGRPGEEGGSSGGVCGVTQRYEQFVQMQERVLMSMLHPREVNERTTFADWMKTAVEGFDRSVWREFQFECSQLIHKYQCKNDKIVSSQQKPPSSVPTVSEQADERNKSM